MLQTYRSKKEVSVLKWDGKKETLDIIKEKICTLCDGLTAYTGYTTNGVLDKDILFINLKKGGSIGNNYNIGDYIVIDSYFMINGISSHFCHSNRGSDNPIKKYSEEQLNENWNKL